MSRMASVWDLELLEEEMKEGNGGRGGEIKLKNMMQGPCEMYVAEMLNPLGKLLAAAPVYVGENMAGMGGVVRTKARRRQDQAQLVSDFILMHTSSWLFHYNNDNPDNNASKNIKWLFVSPSNPFTFKMVDACLKKQGFEYEDAKKLEATIIASTKDGHVVNAKRLVMGEKTLAMYTITDAMMKMKDGDWNACTTGRNSRSEEACTQLNAFIGDLDGGRNILIINKPLLSSLATPPPSKASFNNSKVLVITNMNPEINVRFPEEADDNEKDSSMLDMSFKMEPCS